MPNRPNRVRKVRRSDSAGVIHHSIVLFACGINRAPRLCALAFGNGARSGSRCGGVFCVRMAYVKVRNRTETVRPEAGQLMADGAPALPGCLGERDIKSAETDVYGRRRARASRRPR